jgi:outer membrane biosynthesis protein TonB
MNRMGLLPLCLAVLFPTDGAWAAEPASRAVEMVATKDLQQALLLSVEGTIVIEADGSVGEYAITSKTTPDIDALLVKSIPRWRFEPVLVDGKPVRAKSKMRLSLAAIEAGQNYRVGIENAIFPGPAADAAEVARASSGSPVEAFGRRMNPPVYPKALLRAGVAGRVLLGLHFAPDGKMIEVVPVQSMLFNVRRYNNEARQAVHLLEQSAVDAARLWSVDVKQKPGAATTARDFTAYTTIEYVLGPTPRRSQIDMPRSNDAPSGQWREAIRTPKRAMPWLAGLETPDVGVADVIEGEMLPLAAGPKLKTPLAHPGN